MNHSAVCYGEVLWDLFSDRKRIGGAPLNVALRLNSFGISVKMVSKVGKDDLGEKIISYLQENKVSTKQIQIDQYLKTGQVEVYLDANGSASYNIIYQVAWDKIEYNPSLKEIISASQVFIFGSLVCRDKMSKATLFKLLKSSKFNVFDVNLRPPHYNHTILLKLMNKSDFIKFNDKEIIEICKCNNYNNSSLESQIEFISQLTNTDQICVTLGSKGAVLFLDGQFYNHQGFEVTVVDTVGAGDSFLAALIIKLINRVNPQEAVNFACAIGALVASKSGANPKISKQEIESLLLA